MEEKARKKNITKKIDEKGKEIQRKKYLPIGTVVRLKGAKKRMFITGFCVTGNSDKTKVWDYCGYLYPEGNIRSDFVCLFDHAQIEKIYYLGYENEEEKNFKRELKEFLKNKK